MLDKKIKLQINILAEYQNQVESNLSKKYIKDIFELLRRKYELNEDPEDIDILIENLEESYVPLNINKIYLYRVWKNGRN